MEPIKFKEANVEFAKDQDEYRMLPVYKDADGDIVSCWKLSFKERLKILFTGKFWLWIKTFNKPLQPLLPTVKRPFAKEKKGV